MSHIVFYDCTETDKQQLTQALKATDHYWEFVDEPISPTNLKPESEVISVFVSSTVSAAIVESLPKLKLIACRSTGFNNVDLETAARHAITVTNVPTYGEHTVAEYTFALLLALSRKLREAEAAIHEHDTHEPLGLRGFDLNDKTLGIIGMGKIGAQVARRAHGFNMHLLAYDPFPKDSLAQEYGIEYSELGRLLAESDVVSLHAPLTPDNRHLINAEALAKMKPKAILLNTARGELVDTKALLQALQAGQLGGAGLDVLEGEKLLDRDEELQILRSDLKPETVELDFELKQLAELPNVIITPHNAYNTAEAVERINAITVQNIIRFWYGDTPNEVAVPTSRMGRLILVRHGESEWNALGKWTGSTDVHLTEKGFREAALLGQALADIHIDYAYTSQQIRALETLEGIFDAAGQLDVPFERDSALNERDYGDYTGLNKWEVRDKIGAEAFDHLRRDWDYPVPKGETLKDVYGRAVPYFEKNILPKLKDGKTVLVVSHGNALRALIKHLENISDGDVSQLEMPFGNVLLYELDDAGRMKAKQERKIDTTPPPA